MLAALLFVLTPRTFFHCHLGAFDVPITAMTLACAWVTSQRSGRPLR